MRATLAPAVAEAVLEHPEPVEEVASAGPRQTSIATEGDRIRRQQLLRRKATLARRALAAHRTR